MEDTAKVIVTKDNVAQLMYLRTERQTLRRLPISNAILFTIKTYMTNMEVLCRNDPAVAKELAGAIRNWPSEMVQYKVKKSILMITKTSN